MSTGHGVKLHAFDTGNLHCHVENIKMNQGLGAEIEVPVPWYAIEHPDGLIVIDGGNPAECATDVEGHWGPMAQVFNPDMTSEQACVPTLQAAGFDPADVRYLLQSHLHLDHTGALAAYDAFPNAEVIVSRTEYEYALAPDWYAELAYIQADFNKPGVRWSLLEDEEDGYDLFGDGTIRCWQTPGHAPGHLSFELRTAGSGTVLLTMDASYTRDHWEERALPGFVSSAVDSVRSVGKLRRLARARNATVLLGHDPDEWPAVKAKGTYA